MNFKYKKNPLQTGAIKDNYTRQHAREYNSQKREFIK